MRKIFGGAMLFSALGAAVMGGALAWNASESVSGTNFVGGVNFALGFAPNGAVIGPNDGIPKLVGSGDVDNNSLYHLYYQPGQSSVHIDDVDSFDATCLEDHFLGSVSIYDGLMDGIDALTGPEDGFDVRIATLLGAPSDCQNSLVWWTAYITMGTAP